MKITLVFTFMLVAVVAPLFSQTLSKKDIGSATTTIAQLLEKHYVFEKKGKEIADHLMKTYRSGKFDAARSWSTYDSLATKCLRDFSHDGHLFVRNDPAQVKGLTHPVVDDVPTEDQEDLYYFGPDALENNFGFREVSLKPGNVGYIGLSEINVSSRSLPVLYAAMRFVANTRALIIDLRDNGGGGSDVGAVFESFFLPANRALLVFSARNGTETVEKTVTWLMEPRYDKRVFILINKGTASAAEALAFSLQVAGRATIVGQPSAGAANMNTWFPVNDALFVSVSTAAPVLPGTTRSWEGTGVQPDYVTEGGHEMEVALRESMH